jgi:energy-coupling factor transport system ATP-binding protein
MTGLEAKRRRPSYALSGGEKQRLALAGALALRPRCLVLDEATAMLDPAARADLVALLGVLRQEGMTLIQITHRLEEILEADRAVVLERGAIRFDGTPALLFSDPVKLTEWGFLQPPLFMFRNILAEAGRIPSDCPPRFEELVQALCDSR